MKLNIQAMTAESLELNINSIGSQDCRGKYTKALIEYLLPYKNELSETSKNRLDTNPLRILDSKSTKDIKILDAGCGNAGPFILWLFHQGIKVVHGIDLGDQWIDKLQTFLSSKGISKTQLKLKSGNVLNIPYEDNFFDAIYTKSLIEHISNHEHFFKECKRVLKVNGILITYTPDWETQYLNFYDDITHIKPFTKITLENCYKMYGFENCKVEKFYQLPFIWQFPLLKNILRLISFFIPLRSKIKLFRFAKELMLIGFARKS